MDVSRRFKTNNCSKYLILIFNKTLNQLLYKNLITLLNFKNEKYSNNLNSPQQFRVNSPSQSPEVSLWQRSLQLMRTRRRLACQQQMLRPIISVFSDCFCYSTRLFASHRSTMTTRRYDERITHTTFAWRKKKTFKTRKAQIEYLIIINFTTNKMRNN